MKKIEKWAILLGVNPNMINGRDCFWALCPCHSDTRPSLHVSVSQSGRIWMHCPVCGAKGPDVCRKLTVSEAELDGFPVGRKTDARMDWEKAVTFGAKAVLDKVSELNTRLDTASEDLISSLVECFADRVAREVGMRIDKEIADSTPPMEKTARACGFEQKEKRPEEGAGGMNRGKGI